MDEIMALGGAGIGAGIGAGAAIMALVGVLRTAGLPKRFAGLVTIGIATVLGTIALTSSGTALEVAVVSSILWGSAIVTTHNTIVKPVMEG